MTGALITGVADGNIAHGVAQRFAQDGIDLVLTDLRPQVLDIAQELARIYRIEVHGVVGNVADAEFRESLLEQAFKTTKNLSILVNCAAISRPVKPLDIEVEEWSRVYSVNTEALFFMCQGFVKRLLAQEQEGSIINLSSIAGESGGVNNGIHYASSKAAINAITKGLARAFGKQGIRVNAVSPGVIDTEMARAVPGSEMRVQNSALGRWGSAEEVAEVISFLASGSSSYMTGQIIGVNGGM